MVKETKVTSKSFELLNLRSLNLNTGVSVILTSRRMDHAEMPGMNESSLHFFKLFMVRQIKIAYYIQNFS